MVVPAGLRSFPGIYASSLISEKVTAAPPTVKLVGVKQRYVVLIIAHIPTEADTTVTTSRTQSNTQPISYTSTGKILVHVYSIYE